MSYQGFCPFMFCKGINKPSYQLHSALTEIVSLVNLQSLFGIFFQSVTYIAWGNVTSFVSRESFLVHMAVLPFFFLTKKLINVTVC